MAIESSIDFREELRSEAAYIYRGEFPLSVRDCEGFSIS